MKVISANNLSFSYDGIENIFSDINFIINAGDKIGLVGDNGSGKSTLIKCISKELNPNGNLFINPDIKLSHLKQQLDIHGKQTVLEISYSKYTHVINLSKKIREYEQKIAELSSQNMDITKLLDEYQSFIDEFEKLDGYQMDSEIRGYLAIVGLDSTYYDKELDTLSGGEKARLELALSFMEKANVILLDEPTNHMDIQMINYLEKFLADYKGTLILISHDRSLLQNVCNKIFYMNNGTLEVFNSSYEDFRKEERKKRDLEEKNYENYKKEYERQLEIIKRFKKWNREKSHRQAQSREKMLSRMKEEVPPEKELSIKFNFKEPQRTGNDVLIVDGLSKNFTDKNLFNDLNFNIFAQNKIAIVGPNGSGKSTLLKILTGEITDYRGEFLWGVGVKLGYFNQELEILDEENTLIDEVYNSFPDLGIHRVRTLLANFLFRGDDVFKEMKMLSGGERARISLLKLILTGANVLILDEPTNHLDINSKEILEEALNAFKGTIIIVSHDRYFIDNVADRILDLASEEKKVFEGNLSYYYKKLQENQKRDDFVEENKTQKQKEQKKTREEIRKKQELKKLEKKLMDEIDSIELKIQEIDEKLSDPNIYSDFAEVNELNRKRDELSELLILKMNEWEEVSQFN